MQTWSKQKPVRRKKYLTMEETMSEQRHIKRRHLIYYLRVIDSDTDQLVGFLVDINIKGLMVMSESPIPLGKNFHLKILRSTETDEGKYLLFDAKSRWCDKSVNSDFYDTGFELMNVKLDDFAEIENIIEELGFKD
jgi:hypothetical protein